MADLKATQRNALAAEEFAVPGKRKLPIHDAAHVQLAWDMMDRTKGLTSSERSAARRKILAAAKTLGVDTSDWSKTEMVDMVVSSVEVITDATEEAPDAPMVVRFCGTKVSVVNENNRLYPDPVMTDAVERAIENYVTPGRMVGESPHPKAMKAASGKVVFDTKLENSVILVQRLFKENGAVFLDAEVLETAKGKDLKALIKQGVKPGISMRALGDSVQRIISGVAVEVATFLDIQSFDVVMNPATDGCGALAVLTDSQLEQIFEDGIQISAPACPQCGGKLEPQSPDDDDDVDFLACAPCGVAFIEDHTLRQETYSSHSLSKVTPDNWDRYGLAREWLEKNAKPEKKMTDSVKKDGEIMDHNDLIKAMQEDPAVRAAMAELAGQVAKPALDAVEAQKGADAKAQACTQARAEAKAFLDEQMATLKGKFDEKALQAIADSIGEPETKEMAQTLLASAVKFAGAIGAKAFTDAVGFNAANANQQGQVRVEVGEGPRPWEPIMDAICKEMDNYGEQLGKVIDPKLRAYNRKHVIEKISSDPSRKGMNLMSHIADSIGVKTLCDSAKAFTDSMQGAQMSDAVITTTNLLNQPTILAAILVQMFQDCEFTQFAFTDIFKGSEWRQPSETFTSSQTWNPNTFLQDLAVAENTGITPATVNLVWQSFSPTWRRNAVSLTKDVIRQLQSGPLSYGAVARAIYHITEDKRRKLDNHGYLEMIMASDEFAPLVVTNETPATANLVTATGLPAGTNAGYLYKLVPGTAGYAVPTIASGVARGGNPVVRPRVVNQIQPDGQVTQLRTNAVSVKVANVALTLGAWDGTNIQSFPGTVAQAAIDFEHGILYVMPTGGTGGSGVNPAAATPVLPVISYSAATNYDRWHDTMGTGYTDIAAWYDTLLQQMTATAALMGSTPRFKKPNLALFSLNSATYVENARIFYKWASPDGTKLIDTGNTFGQRSGMNLSRINAPWVAADGRILLSQKGSTRYGIETPYEMEGPFPAYDANQQIVDAKIWYGSENSVLCTPQVKDTGGNIINPVSRTIIIEP